MTGQGDEFKFQLLIPSLPSSFLHMTESSLGRCIDPILHDGGCKPVGLPDQGLPVSCFSSEPTLLTFANFAGNTAAGFRRSR
ncbi:hypothetical protein TNCV_4798961 [Trichonephila clavipes]|nr:hypothetical protein TNCV_4798961 [Trichonephila clavipes]